MQQKTIVPSQVLYIYSAGVCGHRENSCIIKVVADNKTLMALFSDSDTFTSATNIFALP